MEFMQNVEIIESEVSSLEEVYATDGSRTLVEIKEIYFNDTIQEDEVSVDKIGDGSKNVTIENISHESSYFPERCRSLEGDRINEIVENSNVSLQEWMSQKKDVTDMSTEKFLDMILVKAERKVNGFKEAKSECIKFVCTLCNQECVSDGHLANHARTQHKAFKCLFCSKIFAQRYILEKHLYVHTDKRNYSCFRCPLSFKRECDLYSHLKRTHAKTNPIIYRCDKCDYSCKTRFGIKIHILAHDGRYVYNCDECGKGFNAKMALRTHKNNHIGFKPFQCDICGNIFTRGTYLKQHRLMVHENPRSFECALCGRYFSMKATIKNHLKMHLGDKKQFTCDICGRNVSSKTALINHQRIHAGDKRYACDVCNKTYITKLQVKRHAYVHTGHKPYKCDICQRSLSTSSSLIKHLQTHWQSRPIHKCYQCNKTYMSKYKLNSHVTNNHLK